MSATKTAVHYRPMHPGDIGAALRLWRATDGVGRRLVDCALEAADGAGADRA
ncbi:MAG: hypothetical protein ACOCWX_00020 [Spirochaetota bacterium]